MAVREHMPACMFTRLFYLFRFGIGNNYYAGLDEEVPIWGVHRNALEHDNVVAISGGLEFIGD